LTYYRESVEKYGKDRRELGIDMILDEWVGRTKGVTPKESQQAWRDLMQMYTQAQTAHNRPLELRIERVLLFRPGAGNSEKAAYVADLLLEDNITNAPAVVLEFMAEENMKRGNEELAAKAAEVIVKDFTETDHALAARGLLAKLAIKNKDYPAAFKHLTVIREVFASSSEAAEALLTLGSLYLEQKEYDKADTCFKEILSVKEWRGPLWPAALCGRGESAQMKREYETACAYYERVYVMYSHYASWCAKAYLQRAKCLLRLRENDKARETLKEMLSVEALKEFSETEEARHLAEQLETGGG